MATDAVDLALACYRAPLEYKARLAASSPLPDGMNRLLKLVHHPEDLSDRTGVRPEELRKAARFLIQQLCFARGASHYRVLGLDPGASREQIKEHYRLLMRLFHPDRNPGRDTWTDHFASHVNEAWKVLSKPDARADYDDRLRRSRALIPVQAAIVAGRKPAGRTPPQGRPPRPVLLRVNQPRRWRSALILNGLALGVAAFLLWWGYPDRTLRAPLTDDYALSADVGLPLPNPAPVKPATPVAGGLLAPSPVWPTNDQRHDGARQPSQAGPPSTEGMGLEKALKAAQALVERMVGEGLNRDRPSAEPVTAERSGIEQEPETEQRPLALDREKPALLAGLNGSPLVDQVLPAVAAAANAAPAPLPGPATGVSSEQSTRRPAKVDQTNRKGHKTSGRATQQWHRVKPRRSTHRSRRP